MQRLLFSLILIFSPLASFAGKEEPPSSTALQDTLRYDPTAKEKLFSEPPTLLTGFEKERSDQKALTYLYEILGVQTAAERMNIDMKQAAQRGKARRNDFVWDYTFPLDKSLSKDLQEKIVSRVCENDLDPAKKNPLASVEFKSGCHFGIVAGVQTHFARECRRFETINTIETFAMVRIKCKTNHSRPDGFVAGSTRVLDLPIGHHSVR